MFPTEGKYQLTMRLTAGGIPRILTKLLLVSDVSVYNVGKRHCE
jgi:hypothetical protein